MELLTIAGILGIIVALYAIYSEKTGKSITCIKDANGEDMCVNVLKSKYARLMKLCFGLSRNSFWDRPNTHYGLLFYVCVVLYTLYPFNILPFREYLLIGASTGSMVLSVVLIGILYTKLHAFCSICCASWIVNTIIFVLALYQLF
jgi:uncharacterized membrane protein